MNKWGRETLLAFLEDLRPHLPHLEEKELYAIISQSGAMPGFRKAFDKGGIGNLIRDLKENEGRGIEEALGRTSDEELDEAALADEVVIDTIPAEGAPPEAVIQPTPEPSTEMGVASRLPELATADGLRAVDDLAELHYGLDDETAEFLITNRVAALWDAYINATDPPTRALVDEALAGGGGRYFEMIRSRFRGERAAVQKIPVPAGWAFRPPGVGYDDPPTEPNLMQKRTAFEVLTKRRLGNWSGVGAGKTLAGILASRVAGCQHTVVITNKATLAGWQQEIYRAFPDSVVRIGNGPISVPRPEEYTYTLINYERFQLHTRGKLVRELIEAGADFAILDEVQLVKQRDKNASIRREAVAGLLEALQSQNADFRVLGMSATPVINNLLEARKLLEVVMGRSFSDLDAQATTANALAVHRALMVYGFRYRPNYETEMEPERLVEFDGNHLLADLRASAATGVLGLEQTLLPTKLEAVREHVRPGTIVYTHYVDGMIGPIRRFVEGLGYNVGLYTGEDKSGLEPFLAGRVDVLVGSKPVGTGLDGLQTVCDRIIEMSLPWTGAEQEQLVGRIRRQGSNFSRVSVIVPAVVLDHKGDEWSWDKRRWRIIEFKRTLSDCAVDGNIPEAARMSPGRLLSSSRVALEEWIARVGGSADEELLTSAMRPRLKVPLPPEMVKRLVAKRGDFTVLNNRWVSSKSETLHAHLKAAPQDWYLYHTLYRKARETWPEVPAEYIASLLKSRPDLRVGDFGCGEGLLRDALGDGHDVVGLDHVAVDETVVACDMTRTPLEDGELGAAVFSLSLMGKNWREYLAEAHRTLQPFGLLFIAEPARRWSDGNLENAVEAAGFYLVASDQRGEFLYVRGLRRD